MKWLNRTRAAAFAWAPAWIVPASMALWSWAASCALAAPPGPAEEEPGWADYGGDAGGTRYSALTQIDAKNVQRLQIAWTHRTGETDAGFARADRLTFEATPILARGSLYVSTGTNIVTALDPATGKQRWRYDPLIARNAPYPEASSRGVSSWIDPLIDPSERCAHRIIFGTLDARLIALDGRTGEPCADFGANGAVDLARGVRGEARAQHGLISPPAIYMDLAITGSAITGSAIGDNSAAGSVGPKVGLIRAFDARTGELRWSWDPLPASLPQAQPEPAQNVRPAQPMRGASVRSIMSIDAGRGLIFASTGSADPKFYVGERAGANAWTNSLVALRAETGEVVWSRQLVHHDLWDFELAAQPMLVELERDGKSIAAVVQATRTGMLFVLDRETGEPVFEVVERPTPPSDVPGERASPTQPFPATPALVSHAAVAPADAWGLTFIDRAQCRKQIAGLRSEGVFTPPSLQGTIMHPGYAGGVNWGLAFDNDRQLAIGAVNHMPAVVTLAPREQIESMRASGDFPDSQFMMQPGAPYGARRELLLSPLGLPCTAPPWGTLAAVDLRRNEILWQVMLGSTRDHTPWFVPRRTLGMPNVGGPIVTAGGLVFVAAATDNYLRAFDVETGRELWKGRLPAGGQATPMTYEAGGRQFVVIAAGGHGPLGTKRGDFLVAFALRPE